MKYFEKEVGTDKAKMPTPEPSDITRAALVNFEELEEEIKKIKLSTKGN